MNIVDIGDLRDQQLDKKKGPTSYQASSTGKRKRERKKKNHKEKRAIEKLFVMTTRLGRSGSYPAIRAIRLLFAVTLYGLGSALFFPVAFPLGSWVEKNSHASRLNSSGLQCWQQGSANAQVLDRARTFSTPMRGLRPHVSLSQIGY